MQTKMPSQFLLCKRLDKVLELEGRRKYFYLANINIMNWINAAYLYVFNLLPFSSRIHFTSVLLQRVEIENQIYMIFTCNLGMDYTKNLKREQCDQQTLHYSNGLVYVVYYWFSIWTAESDNWVNIWRRQMYRDRLMNNVNICHLPQIYYAPIYEASKIAFWPKLISRGLLRNPVFFLT